MADRTVTYRLSADIGQFKAQMGQAAASVKTAADRMTGATKEGAKFRQGLDTVGSAAGKVGLAAAAGLGAAVMTAANFDQAMSNVQAATMESAAGMESLREAAIKAGAETAFSASEAAAGIENLAKAGVSTQDVLGGGLTGALDLAAAGQMEVADAAEAAATAMTQFGLAGEDVPHVADLLAAAAGKAQGEVSDFAMALNQSGLVAAQMGLSIEETTGSLAAFASAGLLGSDAGTSLKTMLLRLANPSAEAAGAMEKFGINAYDASGNMVSMAELAGQLQTAFAGQSQATRDAALATIFGSDAIRAANVLYNQGTQGITDWTGKVDDAGFAAETASTKLDNLKGDFEAFTGSLETALIGTGEGSQGFFRGLVQGATDAVNAFNDLPSSAKGATSAILGVSAIAGGSIWVGSKFIRGIADTREALDQLGPAGTKAASGLRALGTATVVIGGIIALDAAVDGLLRSMRDAPAGIETMTGQLIDLAAGDAGALGEQFRGLGEDLDFLNSKATAGSGALDWMPNITGLVPGWENAGEQIDRVTDQIDALDAALASLVTSGNAETASAALENLGLDDAQMDALLGQMPLYEEALAGVANQAKLTGDGAKQGADGIGALGDAAGGATIEMDGLAAALEGINAFLDKRSALRNYEAALDGLTDALKRNGANFDRNSEKGRENEAALDEIVASAATATQHLSEVGRVKFVQNSIRQLRDLGRELGIPQPIIQRLVGELKTLGRQEPDPNIALKGADAALGDIGRVARGLFDLDGDSATVTITTVRETINKVVNDVAGLVGFGPEANGGIHVNGVKTFADGGYGMDGRYYQRVPQIVQGGANILWGEAETGREAYISAKAGMESRNVEILSQAASWFGMGIHKQAANGAIVGGGSSPRGVVERIVERMPDRILLDAGNGETLTMFVRRQAGGEVAGDRDYRATLTRQGVA